MGDTLSPGNRETERSDWYYSERIKDWVVMVNQDVSVLVDVLGEGVLFLG